WLILGNRNEAASEYLHRFSTLIRMILSGSGKTTITLEEELTMLHLYLQMEQLRFEDAFEYAVETDDTVDFAMVLVPPLLLQPFCENAIWHGLMHRQEKGSLSIHIHEENNYVYFNITDNGIGRKRSAEINRASAKKPQAMGLDITANRIKLFNRANGDNAFEIEDLLNDRGEPAGTRVMIKIKHQQPGPAIHQPILP
ncbi:MAG TPA: histidine kinase, partial [Phnomibacter sp.]|nr:histidine kinase [Phnomibacter sp.]